MVERLRKSFRLIETATEAVLQPTQEGELRRRVLFWVPAPIPILALVYLVVGGDLSAPGWTILLASSVGVGTLLLALVVQPTPLPEGLSPQVSARRSLHRFRQFTSLRVCLALVPVLLGAAASLVGGGLYPLLAALALAWPQLLLALPTFFTITRARRAMEAWGTTAYLWHALSRRAAVTWPVATPLARAWRRWRQERDRRRAETESAAERTAADAGAVPDGAGAADTSRAAPTERSRGPRADTEDTAGARTGSRSGAGVWTERTRGAADGTRVIVHRAARSIIERGGALRTAGGRDRRGTRSTRRPSSPKH
ncbi:hypothetical protein BJF83_08720 [Nocardiopsis sp. CNR-923]|uniref:hypothetical protein n=1 Tax=Nocardiopsis sp. CNR-923 TaxID=1904965 RepID=UPI00096843BA|nr:hypothetical protein [Nocardiopsis sp. CNR-923]OLT30364.1 hypothetical protein BJF83_08720 [Nocardiopsis sp. CNR-923]